MYNKLNLLPLAHLSEEQLRTLKEVEDQLNKQTDKPIFLMALCPPEFTS